jgi:hypothetical protein
MAGAGGGPMPGGGLMMPKSPIGGPGGPGASPMVSPGGGAGNLANAMTGVKTCHTSLTGYLSAFPAGSKEQQALFRALAALNTIVKDAPPETGEAAKRQMLQQGASTGGPLAGAPPPGVASAPLPSPGAMAPPGGGMGEM